MTTLLDRYFRVEVLRFGAVDLFKCESCPDVGNPPDDQVGDVLETTFPGIGVALLAASRAANKILLVNPKFHAYLTSVYRPDWDMRMHISDAKSLSFCFNESPTSAASAAAFLATMGDGFGEKWPASKIEVEVRMQPPCNAAAVVCRPRKCHLQAFLNVPWDTVTPEEHAGIAKAIDDVAEKKLVRARKYAHIRDMPNQCEPAMYVLVSEPRRFADEWGRYSFNACALVAIRTFFSCRTSPSGDHVLALRDGDHAVATRTLGFLYWLDTDELPVYTKDYSVPPTHVVSSSSHNVN